VYTDWYLPSTDEASLFEGMTTGSSYIWVSTTEGEYDTGWAGIKLNNGASTANPGLSNRVRCVRSARYASEPTAASAQSGTHTHKDAVNYCRNLSASADLVYEGGTDVNIYTDWRLPKFHEISVFIGMSDSTGYLWSTSQSGYGDSRRTTELKNGAMLNAGATVARYVRCVR